MDLFQYVDYMQDEKVWIHRFIRGLNLDLGRACAHSLPTYIRRGLPEKAYTGIGDMRKDAAAFIRERVLKLASSRCRISDLGGQFLLLMADRVQDSLLFRPA